MKKWIALLMAAVLVLSACAALAESWDCASCGNAADGAFCSNCGAKKPSADEGWACPDCGNSASGNFCNSCGRARVQAEEAATDDSGEAFTVQDYVGLNLSDCGYETLGGERRDKYGDETVLLVFVTPDGTWIDPESDKQVEEYTVEAQSPAAGTQFYYTTTKDGDKNVTNAGYSEVVLVVRKYDDADSELPVIEQIDPSPSREVHYLKDYRGRTLDAAGYTTLGGDRKDQYGPEGYIDLSLVDENGKRIDPDDYKNFKYYVVTDQSVAPNTEMGFTYSAKKVTKQTLKKVQLTATLSDWGRAYLEAQAAKEAEMLAEGRITELYKGTYEVGKDLEPGNYALECADGSCNLNIYANKEALDADDGDWSFLWNETDYFHLTEGMFVDVSGDPLKAIRSEICVDGENYELFDGVYYVGEDITPAAYEFAPMSDSCNIYTYDDAEAYADDDGDWDFLWGEEDTETYRLTEGMVVKVRDGAARVTKK